MTCNRYNSYNYTVPFIKNSYEGIPLNLLINAVAFVIFIAIFILLRKRAWNYGDIAWLTKPISLFSITSKSQSSSENTSEHTSVDQAAFFETPKHRFIDVLWHMIPLFMKMSDEELKDRCGLDAVIYCKFQRMLMLISAIMMVAGLTIILPLNIIGNSLSNDTSSFQTLTIANIESGSAILAVHLCIAFILMIVVFFISRHFLKFVDDRSKEKVSITLMITNVPMEFCDESLIEQHFKEAYPSIKNVKVQKTYEIGHLFNLYINKVLAEDALQFCLKELEDFNRRVKVAPNAFGRICVSCKCCEKKCQPLDGIDYYTEEVKRCTKLFNEEKIRCLEHSKLPIFFVYLDSVEHSLMIRKEYIYQNYCCIKQMPKSQSSLSKSLQCDKWNVTFAPVPKDILWENLHKKGLILWIKIILINSFVLFLVIILSTPQVVLYTWFSHVEKYVTKIYSSWGSQFFPSLLIVLVTSAMPMLICWSNEVSAHWTRTRQSIVIMYKLFVALVLTVLILPSLGLLSAEELIINLFNTSVQFKYKFKWNCIFLSDGGALFCNYLISAGFIGMGLEILRLGQLFLFIIKLCCSRSRAEKTGIAKTFLWEFPYGINYAWTLALFAIISAYVVIVPLITPFGCVYLISKHFVDRYNMIYVNIPADIDYSVHVNAAKLLQICLIFTQATVTIYFVLKENGVNVLTGFCFFAFAFGIILSVGRSVSRSILNMAWIKYNEFSTFNELSGILRTPVNFFSPRDNSASVPASNLRESIFVPLQILENQENHILEQMIGRMSLTVTDSQLTSNFGLNPYQNQN